jgi:hypothetical protein
MILCTNKLECLSMRNIPAHLLFLCKLHHFSAPRKIVHNYETVKLTEKSENIYSKNFTGSNETFLV